MIAYVFRKNGECGRLELEKTPEGASPGEIEQALLATLNGSLKTNKDNPFTKAILWQTR